MILSPLQIKLYAALALMAALVVFELVTRLDDRRKIKSGEAEDMRKHDTMLVKHNAVPYPKWRIWSEGILIIATGLAITLTMATVMKYQEYGAFYDASWRSPDVEQHFLFSSKANQDLESKWLADPENFPWENTRICLVKLGCEDCERVEQTIHELEADGYAVVFSTSDLGKAAVEKYGVTYVPSVIMNGLVVQLRSGDSLIAMPEVDETTKSDGEKAQEILDDLIGSSGLGGLATDENGEDPAQDPDYTKYGTKAAQEYAEEQERLQQEASGENQAQN